MTRSELQNLALLRVREARILFDGGGYSGAYYLAGYALECGLKACIAKRTQQYDFPDKQLAQESYVHDLGKLVRVAKLEDEIRVMRSDSDFSLDWEVAEEWSEASRYLLHDRVAALALIKAVGDEESGVLGWIMRHW